MKGRLTIKKTIWHSGFFLMLTGSIFFSFAGCGPVISKEIRDEVSKGLTLSMVAKDPEAYKGKTVLWSGLIISALNLQEGTMIEVLQKPSDFQGKPKDVDDSEGRFLVLVPRYLDVAIYTQGREVTVAGKIRGKKTQSLGEMEYTYPLISARETYLWPEGREERYYHPYPYWWYYPYQPPWWW
jgi:outer membrane lipoprotein